MCREITNPLLRDVEAEQSSDLINYLFISSLCRRTHTLNNRLENGCVRATNNKSLDQLQRPFIVSGNLAQLLSTPCCASQRQKDPRDMTGESWEKLNCKYALMDWETIGIILILVEVEADSVYYLTLMNFKQEGRKKMIMRPCLPDYFNQHNTPSEWQLHQSPAISRW